MPESEALAASSAGSLEPGSGAEAPESALAELVPAEEALSVSVELESELVESEEFESLLSTEDESEEPESVLAACDGAESAESLDLESTVSESEESEDLVSAESDEEPSELSDVSLPEEPEESEEEASELSDDLESEDLASAESEEEASELSDDLESDDSESDDLESEESEDLESEELASELPAVLSDALTEAGSAADARGGAAMTMTTSTSPHRAAARTAILRALASGRAHSVVPMPVTSRHTSSKRGTVSLTVLQFQPRGVSR